MKTLTNLQSEAIRKKTGLEPVLLLKVEVPNNHLHFSDKKAVADNITWLGRILSVGDLTTEQKVSGIGSVASVNFTIEATDRVLMDNYRLCGCAAKIYHKYEGIDETILLFSGKVSTPFEWRESDMTLTFDVVSDIDSREIGKEILESDYIGAVAGIVPISFGTVTNVCLPKIYEKPKVKTTQQWGCSGNWVSIPTTAAPNGWQNSNYYSLYGDYDFILCGYFMKWLPNLGLNIPLDDASSYPLDTEVTLSLSKTWGIIKGKFTNKFGLYAFEVTSWQTQFEQLAHTYDVTFQDGWYLDHDNNGYFVRRPVSSGIDYSKCCFWFRSTLNATTGSPYSNQNHVIRIINVVLDSANTQYVKCYVDITAADVDTTGTFYTFSAGKFGPWMLPSGSDLVFEDIPYVEAYALPLNSDFYGLKVYAYQTVTTPEGTTKSLRELPSDWHVDYNFRNLGFPALVIERPISEALDQKIQSQFATVTTWESKWDSKIVVSYYHTQRGDQMTNVAKIIKWILETYTNVVCDTTTFDQVAIDVDKYPANFIVTEKKDALTLVSEIAWQARCALNIVNGIAYLKYLSKRPTIVSDVRDDVIEEATVSMYFDELTQVVTHLTAKWKKDCLADKDIEIVYKNNIDIFGLHKQEYTFYIYANQDLIKKSLTFWGQRYSNLWKHVKCATFLPTVPLEYLDAIYLRSNLIESLALCESIAFNTDEKTITLDTWTPILAGTSTESNLAWLDDSADVKPNVSTVLTAPALAWDFNLNILYRYDSEQGGSAPVEDVLIPAIAAEDESNGTVLLTLYANGYNSAPTGITQAQNINKGSTVSKGEAVMVSKIGDTYYTQAPGGAGGSVHLSGSNKTVVDDGLTPVVNKGDFGQVFTLVNNELCINLSKVKIASGTTAVSLSTLLSIVSGALCIKTTTNFTGAEGTAPLTYKLDGTIFLPTSTFLRD